MHNTTIKSWKKHPLSPFVHEHDGTFTALTLVLMGVCAAIIHQHFRLALNLPGHHGLEWMTVLLFGRMASKHRWAGVILAAGAASAYVAQSGGMAMGHSLKPAFVFLLNGVCLDLIIRSVPKRLPLMLKGMLLGGVTFMIKPALLLPLGMVLGVSFGSFEKHGYLYPVLTHFAFGTAGAMAGLALAQLLQHGKPADSK